MFRDSSRTVICWAMGLTQHRNSVATIKEIANVAFLQGNIGKPGAGLCPVRGHSNVQGDRTMGIWERPKPEFLDALRDEFHFEPPREHGFDAVEAVKALADGRARVFFAMGGNFVSAVSDTDVTEQAMRNAELTVHVSTKLNRSHVVHGRTALILPALGRSEKDLTGGREQRVTVEDSMSAVHASKGPLEPASDQLRSEVDIVCSLALATLGGQHGIPWGVFRSDYTTIRQRIARVVPGCAAYDEKVDQPGGFTLPHPPRDSRTFPTDTGKAIFSASPLEVLEVPEGHLLLQTLRSHDQFNTTIYGLDDRYRGVKNGRRVVFVHPDDIDAPRLEGRRPRRPGQRLARRLRAGRDRVPDRVLRPAARLRRGLLPGDEPAGPARLQGRGQQHPDVEVGHRPAREAGRPPHRRDQGRAKATRSATSGRPTRSTSPERTPTVRWDRIGT